MTTVKALASFIWDILKSDRDCPIAITGGTGEGKSTLEIALMKATDKHFSINKNIVYSRKVMKEKLITLPNFSGLGVDEAINVLFRREWQAGEQKNIIKILDMCRDKNMFIVFAYPNFWSLDSHVLQSRIKLWIFIPMRGNAIIFKPDKNPFTTDAWHRKENEKIFEKAIKFEGDFLEGFKSAVMQSPNYVDWLQFDDLDEEDKKEYLEHKLKSKMAFQEEKLLTPKEVDKIKEAYAIDKSISVILRLKEKGFLKKGYGMELASIYSITREAMYNRISKIVTREGKQSLNIKDDLKIKEETKSETNELLDSLENGNQQIQSDILGESITA